MVLKTDIKTIITSTLKSICSIFCIFAILFSIAVWNIQPNMFFHPWHDADSYNRLMAESEFEKIVIQHDEAELHGWLKINNPEKNNPLVIFYGGNAQNSSNTCTTFLDDERYVNFGSYNFLCVDYPGYGLSDGEPSDESMFDAALRIYDYACQLDNVDPNNIVVIGYSIGTGSATYVASQRDVSGLILVAPYDRALSLYNSVLDIFHGPLKMLARYEFNSIGYAPNVNVQPLIITSKADEIINYELSLNLSKSFKDDPKLLILDGIGHNYYFSNEIVWENIYDYLND